jgi:hypothetical protein
VVGDRAAKRTPITGRGRRDWCGAFRYRITDRDHTGVGIAGDSSAPTIVLLASSDTKQHKNGVHLDVCPVAGSNSDEGVCRFVALGAAEQPVEQPPVFQRLPHFLSARSQR